MESAFNGDYVARCGKRGHTSSRLPYLSLSAAHISWYKLIREMPFIDPLEALNARPAYSLSMTATVNQARS